MKQYILLSKIVHISAFASKYLFLITFERSRGFGPQMHGRNTKNASHGEKETYRGWLPNHPRIQIQIKICEEYFIHSSLIRISKGSRICGIKFPFLITSVVALHNF